jgi:hypothetical protein
VWVSILTGSGDNAAVNELLVTPADAIVVHGRFAGTLDCDPSTEVFELQSGVHAEPFFLCLNDQGGLVWAGKTSRLTGPGEMVCDAMNRLWIPMAWNLDSEDLDPTMGEWTQDPLGKSNSILLTLDADTGVILEHRRVQSSWPGFARLGALALAPSNQSIRWGGGFGDAPLDVDPGPGTKLLTPPNEGSHGLVLRLNPDGSW